MSTANAITSLHTIANNWTFQEEQVPIDILKTVSWPEAECVHNALDILIKSNQTFDPQPLKELRARFINVQDRLRIPFIHIINKIECLLKRLNQTSIEVDFEGVQDEIVILTPEFCKSATDVDIMGLVRFLEESKIPVAEIVNLSKCAFITSVGLAYVIEAFPELRYNLTSKGSLEDKANFLSKILDVILVDQNVLNPFYKRTMMFNMASRIYSESLTDLQQIKCKAQQGDCSEEERFNGEVLEKIADFANQIKRTILKSQKEQVLVMNDTLVVKENDDCKVSFNELISCQNDRSKINHFYVIEQGEIIREFCFARLMFLLERGVRVDLKDCFSKHFISLKSEDVPVDGVTWKAICFHSESTFDVPVLNLTKEDFDLVLKFLYSFPEIKLRDCLKVSFGMAIAIFKFAVAFRMSKIIDFCYPYLLSYVDEYPCRNVEDFCEMARRWGVLNRIESKYKENFRLAFQVAWADIFPLFNLQDQKKAENYLLQIKRKYEPQVL